MKKIFFAFSLLPLCGCETAQSADWLTDTVKFVQSVIALI